MSQSNVSHDSSTETLAATARLFGRLLVRELDAQTLEELQQSDVRNALAEVGIDVPQAEQLDELAHDWLSCFLHPESMTPPVHSLYRHGSYDGDAAAAVRGIASTAGLEQAAGARNAAPDHIGSILVLWAELTEQRPDLARLLAEQHTEWAEAALQPAIAEPDRAFYASVARATCELLPAIREHSSATFPAPSV
ncbi:MAG: molecular chaperone [Planctomycetota bacterium]